MQTDARYHLSVIDYIVFTFTLVISLGIGVYYAVRGQKTTSEFIVASRNMKVFPLAISLMVSFESSIMMLGMPAEVYIYGFSYILSMVGFCISQFLSAFIFVPFFRRQKVTSVFEYLEKRFESRMVRNIGTSLGILSYMCYLGIVLYGPGIALEAVTGLPLWTSIVVVALGSAIYTTMGGMKAVVWTDVFQSCIMYAGMIAVFIKGCMALGGFRRIWTIALENQRLKFDFGLNPYTRHTVVNVLFSSILRGFGLVFNQSTIQRISSTRNMREAKMLMFITSPLFCLTTSFSIIIGLLAFAYFQTIQCDPLEAKLITNPNQIMPLFVTHAFQHIPGMPGLFIASLFSASLSTLSSGLSSLSTVTWIDLIKPRVHNITENRATLIAKALVFFYGLLSICLAFLVSLIGGPLTQIASVLISAFAAPLTGLHLYATLCPWGKERGAVIGTFVSCGMTLWMSYGSAFSPTRLKTPRLPPASMDNCIFGNETSANITGSRYLLTTPLPVEQEMVCRLLQTCVNNATLKEYLHDEFTVKLELHNTQLHCPGTGIACVQWHGLDKMYSLSYTLISVVGILSMLLIGSIIDLPSYDSTKVNPENVVHLFDQICCCLPNCIRKLCRCGITYKKDTSDDDDDDDQEKSRDTKPKALQSISHIDYPRSLEMTIYTDTDLTKKDITENVIAGDLTATDTQTADSIDEEGVGQETALLSSENNTLETELRSDLLGFREVLDTVDHNRSEEEAIEAAMANISQSVHEMESEVARIVEGGQRLRKTPPITPTRTSPLIAPPPVVLNADSVSDLTLSDEDGNENNDVSESAPVRK